MIDVHPPEHAAHTWKDFFIHIATICVGLLIAIGLEQSVEAIHHHRQRTELEQDLHDEAINNRNVIARNLNMQHLEGWFANAVASVDNTTPAQGKLHIDLPPAPCIPGSVGTASIRYFAPSEAVLSTARENGLITLLPVASARMYARLDHNYKLLADQRDTVFNDCNAIAAMQQRLALPTPGAATLHWTLTPAQAELLAQTASNTEIGIKGLCFRLRWSDVYEQGLIDGETKADIHMMTIDQERYEDPPTPAAPPPPAAQPTSEAQQKN
ncbi:MAG: hypothetical protein WBY53_04455 [Acidobacteriaceae bacterium]